MLICRYYNTDNDLYPRVVMNKMLFSFIAAISMNSVAASWQPIAITKSGTKLYIDKDSILMNADIPEEVLYKSRLESNADGNGLKKGELLVATETINCANGNKTLYSLVKYNPAGQISYKSTDDGRAINVAKVGPNTIYANAMKYLCAQLPQNPSEQSIDYKDTNAVSPFDSKNIWSFVTQDDNVLVQIDDTTITANSKSKMVAFTSKMIAKKNNSPFMKKGEYFLAKNMSDCEKNTVARLHVAKYTQNDNLISEERYAYSNLKFRIANDNKISGDIQKYVCKSIN